MITFEEAKKKARGIIPEVNNCLEYEDAFVFGIEGDTSIGSEPLAVMKEDGRVLWMVEYCNIPATKKVKDWGVFR